MRTLIVLALTVACAAVDEARVEQEVLAEFRASEQAWNEGSVEGFMQSYLPSENLRFAGHDNYTLGWDQVLANYKKGYPDQEAMGRLRFSEVDVTVLSPDAALVFGRWQVEKKEETSEGLYTLIFRKTPDGWRIVHDHTTSAED